MGQRVSIKPKCIEVNGDMHVYDEAEMSAVSEVW